MLCTPWVLDRCEALVALERPEFVAYPTSTCSLDALDRAKSNVGAYKVRNGEDRWKEAVASVAAPLRLESVVERPITRAYFKLVEIARTTVVPAPRRALHLCEAPGGFAQAVLSEFPTCERVFVASLSGDRLPKSAPAFSRYLLHQRNVVHLDVPDDGDVLRPSVRDALTRAAPGCDLITADGGIDMDSEPELTEAACAALVACQADVALRAQALGGTFVLKVFTITQPVTREIVALLTQHYSCVSLLKPKTSHPVNDERYVVCQGYHGRGPPLPALGDCTGRKYLARLTKGLDARWEDQLHHIVLDMAMQQRQALLRALAFKSTSSAAAAPPRAGGSRPEGASAPAARPERPYEYPRRVRSRPDRTA